MVVLTVLGMIEEDTAGRKWESDDSQYTIFSKKLNDATSNEKPHFLLEGA